MADEALDAVRVTAERVQRFVDDVEQAPSEDARERWRASLDDLRRSIREARAQGFETEAIQEATSGQSTGRFQRPPAPVKGVPQAQVQPAR
jgi:hypothetical protein